MMQWKHVMSSTGLRVGVERKRRDASLPVPPVHGARRGGYSARRRRHRAGRRRPRLGLTGAGRWSFF